MNINPHISHLPEQREESLALSTLPCNKELAQDNVFEQLLNAPTQPMQSDAYYWQQQSKLQPSALTFKAKNIQDKLPNSIPQITQTSKLPPKAGTAIEEATISHVFVHLEKSITETTQCSKLAIEQLIKCMAKCIEQPRVGLEQKPFNHSNKTVKSTPLPLNKPILPADSTVKPYQLYVTNNQIELSLNTAHLSQSQLDELHLLINDWLIQKGYTLKQLIINGIQQ